jgi:hypothetical protein
LPPDVGERIRLHDPDIDTAQEQDIGDILHGPFADDRQHAEVFAVVEHACEVGGDAQISAVHAA